MDIARILSLRSENFRRCNSNFNLPVTNPNTGFTHHVDSTSGTSAVNIDNEVKNFVNLNLFSFSMFPRVCASEDPDEVKDAKEKERKRIKEMLSKEDKWDRLHRMYSYDDFGFISPELRYILKGAYISLIMGGMLGAFQGMKQGREKFFRTNVATAFDSEHLARRNLTDKITLSGIKGFFQQGFKFGSFSSLYLLGTLTAANFNNKVTVWEHMACAAVIGSISRINFGIKGMAVAGLLGSVLGLVSGGMIKASMWMSDTSVEELRYWQHEYYLKEFSAEFPKQNVE